jgi:pre-60S factor REI1
MYVGKQMRSGDAARLHMIDKGHCKIRFDEESKDEYLEFYDYRYTYPDWIDADPDEELSEPDVFLDEGYELKLPTGKVIGHRSLMRYYKQYLKANTVILNDQKSPRDNVGKMRNKMMLYNSLGGEAEAERAEKKRIRDVMFAQKIHTKYSTQLQSKQNKLRKHFRPQIRI